MSHPNARILLTGPSGRGWHRLQTVLQCPQKYAWDLAAKRKAAAGEPTKGQKNSPALIKGSLIHLALAQHYARMRAAQQGEDVDDWAEPEEAVSLVAQLEGNGGYVTDILATFQAYRRFYAFDHKTWKILEVEAASETHVRGHLLTGRLDLLVEDVAGRIWVVDHKSTARISSQHRQFYSISGQLIGYLHLARARFGVDAVAGIVVNLVQSQPASNGSYKYERVELSPAPHLESSFAPTVEHAEKLIAEIEASDRPPGEWPKAMNELTCYTRYGPCEHLDKCRFGAQAGVSGSWEWSG